MNDLTTNALAGSGISFAISALKKLPLVKAYPKLATAILTALVSGGLVLYNQHSGSDTSALSQLLQNFLTQFTAAIATHETVTHTVVNAG